MDLLNIDWNPLLCQIAALRYELRAHSFALLSTIPETHPEHLGELYAKMEYEQARADRIAKGGKA